MSDPGDAAVEQRWTDSLHLRRPAADDLHGLVGEDEAAAVLAAWSGDGLGPWLVEHHGRPVGVAGLRYTTFHLRPAWLLEARFDASAWGRGWALEAVHEALVVAQEHSARMPVVARTRPDDAHGAGLAERAGLERRKDLDRDGLETRVSHW